jgi:hypothetical protein
MSLHPELTAQSAPERELHASGVPEQVPTALPPCGVPLPPWLPLLSTPGQSLHARHVVSATPTNPAQNDSFHTKDRMIGNEAPKRPRRKRREHE